MRAADYEDLPELSAMLPPGQDYRWAGGDRLARFLAEVRALRSSTAMGYYHHAELHQRQAIELLLLDMASRDHGCTASGECGRC